jgi:AraC-like DNA-binding protein
MQYVELDAPPPLNDLVHCFWFLRGEFPAGEPQTVVADGRLEIVLHLAEPFSKVEDGRPQRQENALVAGQITAPVVLTGNGTGDVVGIRFRTHAASAFLQCSLNELTDRIAPLSDLSGRLALELLAAARSSTSPRRRVEALARALGRSVRSEPDPLATMATLALSSPGAPRVETIARSLGTTTRTLERRLTIATGLTPATLRRVMRFRRAFRMLNHAPRGRWAEVATRSGYADQSHLIRDFRQFAGMPPTEFFAAEPELALNIMASDSAPVA